MSLSNAKPDLGIECRFPPATMGRLLQDMLQREIPTLNSAGPPVVIDTIFDERGIMLSSVVEVTHETGGSVGVLVRGTTWTWDGDGFAPDHEVVEVLVIQLLPAGYECSLAWVHPAFDVEGLADHVRALLRRTFGTGSKEEAIANEVKTPDTARSSQGGRDSGHFSFSEEDRRRIVEEYRKERAEGKIFNKKSWASANYGISDNTLRAYEREFPEDSLPVKRCRQTRYTWRKTK